MTSKTSNRFNQIYLVSMPWPLFKRPSIQLGSLKSYLGKHSKHTRVDTLHVYLDVAQTIGYDVYQAISKRTWLAEPVYAALLYPNRFKSIEQLFWGQIARHPLLKKVDFSELVLATKKATDQMIVQTEWQNVELVGFSMCLCQLTSTLYALKQIKKRSQNIITVIGGSMVSIPNSRDYLDVFEDMDVIVNGEGEQPLAALLHHLESYESFEDAHYITGVVTRKSPKLTAPTFSQLQNLNELPTPDYRDYFKQLKGLPSEKQFFATLPVETSRGCWWLGHHTETKGHGCAFCNLNLQWSGYRKKSASSVLQEINQLTTRHQTLSVAFMDNVLPPKTSKDLFSGLLKTKKDFQMFSEIRATTSSHTLKKMYQSGMVEVQVGIESLSSSLLKMMNKGTTAIENIAIMKNCEGLGIKNVSNLMLCFPGSDDEQVKETLENLSYVTPYKPLQPVQFWLGLGSPVYSQYPEYNIQSRSNHRYYRILFPDKVFKAIDLPIQVYRGDLILQRKRWRPVEKKIEEWQNFYSHHHKIAHAGPILGFLDGKDFLIIRQARWEAAPQMHRLTAMSRRVYLFCHKIRSIKQILEKIPEVSEEKLIPFIRMMVAKKLMFEEQGKVLSLAIKMRK